MVIESASIEPPQAAPYAAQHSAALGAPSVNLLGDLHALQMMGEHLARSLRGVFEPLFRHGVKLSSDPIKVFRFEDYLAARGDKLAAHSLLAMAPLSGQAMIVLDGALVLEATDLFFGGAGALPIPMPIEFTPSSEAIIRRLVTGMAERMGAAWADLATISFTPGGMEASAHMLSHVDADDRMVLTRFQLQLSDTRRSAVDILYPVAALKPIAPALCAKVSGRRTAGPGGDWQNGLTRAVMDVPIGVRSVLAETTIPLQQLMALKEGDIIPISFGPDVPLIVAGNRFAHGAVGAANGHAAVRVSRIVKPETEERA